MKPSHLIPAVALLILMPFQSFAVQSLLPQPVRVESGLLEGMPGAAGDVTVFKGIPYAAPPVGDQRWREPQPALKWEGVRKADAYGASCPQLRGSGQPPYTHEFAAPAALSEDCLFLNVWTPAKTASDKLATLLYIHGGSGVRGSGSSVLLDGEALARKGIIVITINFRLGIFSGMGHPQLTEESRNRSCGNYGMLDMIAALQWVQKNIASFGGDPGKVTIAGHSSGCVAMHYLTTSPLTKGLFRSAIAISFPYDYLTKQHAIGNVWQKEQEGLKFAAAKKLKTLADLRAMSPQQLMADDPAVGAFTRACLSGSPNVDGWSFVHKYPQALQRGLENDVPTLTGITIDDYGPPAQYSHVTLANYVARLPLVFGENRQAFTAIQDAYLAANPVTTDLQASEMVKRAQIEYRLCDVFHWAKARSKTAKSPVYTYLFEQPIPWPQHPQFGAFHGADLVYFFNNLNKMNRPWTADDHRVADLASSYWVQFVKTGNPNGEGLPLWKPFDADDPTTMSLSVKPGPREIAGKARIEFYRQLLEK